MTAQLLATPKRGGPAQPFGAAESARIRCLDVARGIAVVLMIFLNQVETLQGTPAWLLHVPNSTVDAVTIRDYGPAAFLFLVGVSIPVALEGRLRRGHSTATILGHNLGRSLLLVLLGLTITNVYEWRNGVDFVSRVLPVGWPAGLWDTLLWVCWLGLLFRPRGAWSRGRVGPWAVKLCSLAAMAGLWWIAATCQEPGFELGLRFTASDLLVNIGACYLIASCVAFAYRDNPTILLGFMTVLFTLSLASQHEAVESQNSTWWTIAGLFGTYPAIVIAGTFAWSITFGSRRASHPDEVLSKLVGFGAALGLEAILMHRFVPINMHVASPTWALAFTALSCWILALLYWLVAAGGWARWSAPVEAVGRNALMAYLLPAVLSSLAMLLGLPRNPGRIDAPWALGCFLCAGYTVFVCWVAAKLTRAGISPRADQAPPSRG